jgi:prophage maintenance system killer protein
VPRDVEIKRKRMWYPTEKIVVKTHEMMLQRFGGHPCFERGMPVFRHILEEIKKTNGIYRKAAIILRGIVIGRIFKDGNHRTAFEVTRTFLEMNGTRMKAKNAQEIIRIY